MNWRIHSASTFAQHAAAWDRVNDAGPRLPFLHSDFIRPLLVEFGTGREWLAIGGPEGSETAVALVVARGKGVWETFQPSQLPLGAWALRQGVPATTMMDSLLRSLPGLAVQLGLTQADPRFVERPAEGHRVRSLDYIDTAWVELEGTFDAYWESRGKNLRTNMAKQRRKLEAEGIVPTLEALTRPEQVAEGLRDYGTLESAGWKATGGTAIALDNAQGRFYRAMLEAFCARGEGRIYRYRFGDKVVAVDLCVEQGDVQVVLKTTYDESIKNLSPAFLMRQDELRALWPEGRIRRVEFYGRVMEWHTRWTDKSRTLYHVNLFRWPFVAKLRDWLRKPDTAPAPAEAPTASAES